MRRFTLVVASLSTLLLACGDDEGPNRFLDGGDIPDDASADDAVVTTVNVTALARSYEPFLAQAPRQGVLVFAVSPTNTLVDTATTDAAGQATVSLPDGGSVTVAYPGQSQGKGDPFTTIVTYAGVKPGDNLTFGDRATRTFTTTGEEGSVTLSWAAVDNATYYRVYSRCNGVYTLGNTSTELSLSSHCQTATAPISLVAYDTDNQVLAHVLLPAAAYTPGSTVTIAAGDWIAQTPATNYTINLTNVEAGVTSLNVAGYDDLVPGELGQFWYDFAIDFASVAPTAGTATRTVSLVTAAARPTAAAKLPHNDYVGRHWFFKAGATPLTIDTAGVPWIQSYSLENRQLSWTQTAGTYDAMHLRFNYNNYEWTVILPPGVTQLDLSAAPAELAPYLPTSTDSPGMSRCQLVDLSSAASYDALRALPEWRTTGAELSVRAGDEPAAVYADCGEGFHI